MILFEVSFRSHFSAVSEQSESSFNHLGKCHFAANSTTIMMLFKSKLRAVLALFQRI